jgi:putative membrane protein
MSEAPGPDGAEGDRPSAARAWLVVYLKGVAMGAADTVPGVSGGTIALITGIYERLVTAIAAVDLGLVRRTVGWRSDSRRLPLREAARRIDLAFLVVLGLGILTAVLAVSGVLAVSLERYRAPTNAFFFGLIAASAVVLYGEVALDTPRRWAAAVLAAGFAFWLTGATASGGVPHGFVIVLLTGTVTSSAMLLPGISGAALLYVLGQYEFMIDALHGFVRGLTAVAGSGDPTAAVANGTVVATFLLGVAVGLVTVAHAVRWALRRDRGTTLTVLVSLMVGALRLPAEEVLANTARWTPMAAVGVLGAAAVGGLVVLALDRYTDDLDYDV